MHEAANFQCQLYIDQEGRTMCCEVSSYLSIFLDDLTQVVHLATFAAWQCTGVQYAPHIFVHAIFMIMKLKVAARIARRPLFGFFMVL
jgi:hypothetical protein